MKRTKLIANVAGTVAAAGLFAVSSLGQIQGTAHDFSTSGWSKGEICLPCHTPHNATITPRAPLWNHELTVASYQIYAGDGTFIDTNDALDARSIQCMSCHDGTVALDSFGGQTGSTYMPISRQLGTDLRDDHPVGVTGEYPIDGDSNFNAAVLQSDGTYKIDGVMRLEPYNILGVDTNVVSCTTCHSPHGKGFDDFLRINNNASALCLACHIK